MNKRAHGSSDQRRQAQAHEQAGATPTSGVACRHCDEPLMQEDSQDYWRHAHGLYRCQQKVAYGHNAAHPDVPCESLGPINRCACLR